MRVQECELPLQNTVNSSTSTCEVEGLQAGPHHVFVCFFVFFCGGEGGGGSGQKMCLPQFQATNGL